MGNIGRIRGAKSKGNVTTIVKNRPKAKLTRKPENINNDIPGPAWVIVGLTLVLVLLLLYKFFNP